MQKVKKYKCEFTQNELHGTTIWLYNFDGELITSKTQYARSAQQLIKELGYKLQASQIEYKYLGGYHD